MVSSEWVIENIKKTNHWVNHRVYTEKVLKDYLEFGVDTRIKNPTLTQNWTVLNQYGGGGRGTPFFDKIEKMIQVERAVIGVIGSNYGSADRLFASKQTFNNSINTNTINNPNFSIYNAKIKAENQKIMDMELLEEQRLAEILKEKVRQDEIKRNSIIPEIIPEILPSIVATSSLLPLGIIGLLLYTSMGRK